MAGSLIPASAVFLIVVLVVSSPPYAAARDKSLPGDVRDWDAGHISDWIDSLKMDTAVSSKLKAGFEQAGVTGNILLWVDESDLQDDLGISSKLQRKRIMAAIQELNDKDNARHGGGSGPGVAAGGAPMSFWELKSMNRKQIMWITPLVTTSPRYAISKLAGLPPHAQPPTKIGWIEYIFLPEYYLFANRNTILGGLPGLMWLGCLTQFVARLVALVASAFPSGQFSLKGPLGVVGVAIMGEVFGAVLSWLWMTLLWPFIPWFICDLFFLGTVYIFPLFGVAGAFKNIKSSLEGKKGKTN